MAENNHSISVLPDNAALIDRYKLYKRADWRSDRTRESKHAQLRYLSDAVPEFATATRHDLQDWRDSLNLHSVETQAAYVSTATGLFHWLSAIAEVRPDDPAALLRRPRVPQKKPRPMQSRHYDLALACALHDPEMWVWLGMMGIMGLRSCEIAWLQVADVEEFADGTGLATFRGKGAKVRSVPVPAPLMEALRPFLVGRGAVFTRVSDGRAYRPDGVRWKTNRFLKEIGIDETAHQLRHRFGTDYHEIDPDVLQQAALMGHSNPQTTMLYTQLTPMAAAKHVATLAERRLRRQVAQGLRAA